MQKATTFNSKNKNLELANHLAISFQAKRAKRFVDVHRFRQKSYATISQKNLNSTVVKTADSFSDVQCVNS